MEWARLESKALLFAASIAVKRDGVIFTGNADGFSTGTIVPMGARDPFPIPPSCLISLIEYSILYFSHFLLYSHHK